MTAAGSAAGSAIAAATGAGVQVCVYVWGACSCAADQNGLTCGVPGIKASSFVGLACTACVICKIGAPCCACSCQRAGRARLRRLHGGMPGLAEACREARGRVTCGLMRPLQEYYNQRRGRPAAGQSQRRAAEGPGPAHSSRPQGRQSRRARSRGTRRGRLGLGRWGRRSGRFGSAWSALAARQALSVLPCEGRLSGSEPAPADVYREFVTLPPPKSVSISPVSRLSAFM